MIKKIFKFFMNKNDYTKYIPHYNFNAELSSFEAKRELSNISTIYWALLLKDNNLKKKAVNLLSDTIDKLGAKSLILLDKIFRSTSSYDWSYDWKSESINSLLTPNMSKSERITIIGLSTFHPNGYFREKALDELITIDSGKVLPFIIIRTNDWVPAIREKASKYLIDYINEENFVSIMENFTLLTHIKEYSRTNYKRFIEKIDVLINSEELKKEILNCGNFKDNYAREFCYIILIEKNLANSKEIINIILKEPISRIRGKAVDKILKTLSDEEVYSLKDILLNDKGCKVREVALIELYKRGYFNSTDNLEFALFDKYSSVRELTRFYMNKLGFNDFVKLYKERLLNNSSDEIALLGLSEVATIKEVDILKNNLNCNKVRIIKKLLKCLANIDFNNCKFEVIDSLKDKRVGVSNEAKRILINNKDTLDIDSVYQIYKESNILTVERNAAIVLCNCSKWDSITFIMEICSSSNESILNIGINAINRWRITFNKSFTQPTSIQLEAIENSFNKYRRYLKKDFINWFNFTIENR